MSIPEGSYRIGPESGRLLVKTSRTGLGAKAGHDLTLRVTRWRGSVTVRPADPAACAVAVTADAGSIEVADGTGGVKPLTDSDRSEIRETMRGKILHTSRFPEISFRSTGVSGSPESFRIEGDLTIVGVTQPVTIDGRVAGGRVRGEATVTQSRWGIKPYSAFMGALRLRDDVTFEFDLDLADAG